MNEFLPISATRYNDRKVPINDVISPPYDVISDDFRSELYARSPFNVVRVEYCAEPDPYSSAQRTFAEWKSQGILVREDHPSFFVYSQTFTVPNGEQVTRTGVIGRLKVSPYSEGNVLPHEQTLPKFKEDRFQLLESVRAQLSPIFGLVDDESGTFDYVLDGARSSAPVIDADERLADGTTIRHTLWHIQDTQTTERISGSVNKGVILIADGHHRYETSVAFRAAHPELRDAAYIMIFLANIHSSGTVILPTHRVLHSLHGFDQYTFLARLHENFSTQILDENSDLQTLLTDTRCITVIEFPDEPRKVAVYDKLPATRTSALEQLPVYRLHEEILKPLAGLKQEQINAKTNLLYPHTYEEFQAMAANGYNAAFFLRSVSPQEMLTVSREGNFMPQKSTYFYPKLATGLLFYEFLG
jgi:uncharacterized protein (DUF1015 family)